MAYDYVVQVKEKGGKPGNPQSRYAKIYPATDNPAALQRLSSVAREPIRPAEGNSPQHVDVPQRKWGWLARLGIQIQS